MSETSSPSDMDAKACEGQSQPTLPFTQLVNRYTGFLHSLKLNGCVTDSLQTTADTTIKASAGFFGISASSGSETKQTENAKRTSGCSAINSVLQAYNKSIETVKCIINSDTTNVITKYSNINKVDFEADGNLTIDCPSNFNINQSINGTFNQLVSISDDCKINITKSITGHINGFLNAIKNTYKSEPIYGPDGQGTKTINGLLSSDIESTIQNNVNTTVSNISTIINEGNNLTLKSKGDLTIEGSNCNIDQNIQISIVSSQIVDNAFNAVFTPQNLPSLFPPPLPYTPSALPSHSKFLLILIGVILIGVLVWYYMYYKRRKVIKNVFY